MRKMLMVTGFAGIVALAGCQSANNAVQSTLNTAVPASVTAAAVKVSTQLDNYQTALGIATVASVVAPSVNAVIVKDSAAAAPYVAAAKAGATDVATATTLRDLATDLLNVGAPYITAKANK